MKRILLIATGGTIASRKTDDGLTPQLTPQELLSYIPDAISLCHIDTTQPPSTWTAPISGRNTGCFYPNSLRNSMTVTTAL